MRPFESHKSAAGHSNNHLKKKKKRKKKEKRRKKTSCGLFARWICDIKTKSKDGGEMQATINTDTFYAVK